MLALGAAGAFAATQYVERPAAEPATPKPGSAVASSTPAIVVNTGTNRVRDLRVLLDGRDVTARARGAGEQVVVEAPALREGRHVVAVSYATDNVFARTVSRTWGFLVDTRAPRLAIEAPGPAGLSNRNKVRFAGTAEPRSTVRVEWPGGKAVVRASGRGDWQALAKLPEGRVATRVTVLDRAGNATLTPRPMLVDTRAPQLTLANVKSLRNLSSTDEPLIYGLVPNEDPTRLTFGATVNGVKVAPVRGSDATAPNDDPSDPYTQAAVTTGGSSLQLNGRKFALGVGALPQGRNTVKVWVRDIAGNRTGKTFRAFVDTSSELGAYQLVRGAKGADVTTLQERLASGGLYRGKPTGVYDKRTMKAVRAYQRKFRLGTTGQVNAPTLRALVGKLVVDLSDYRVTLYRDGKSVISYPVAVGQSAYPTPTGTFEIVNKQVDPTWSPPDSPWAAGLGPIPPGPGNPLGTRWIGTSASAVGLHGTYDDSSIGTNASHGCIRMHISDVEDLYERVSVGMPVEIQY